MYRQLSASSLDLWKHSQAHQSKQLHLHTSVCVSLWERGAHEAHVTVRARRRGGGHTCEMTYIFGNPKWSVFTFLYAQFTSAAPGLLYFKFPPTWPKLPVSTGLMLIRSLILTDILKVHTNSGMFGAMLPTANACQYY